MGFKGWLLLLLGLLVAAPQPCLGGRKPKGFYHTVERGETLFSIARAYRVPCDSIRKANRIKNPDRIYAGEVLFVPKGVRPSDRKKSSRPKAVDPGAPAFSWPLKGQITSRFGPRHGRFHRGIDIAAPKGIIITASAEGKVVRVGKVWRDYGIIVLVDHGKGYFTLYAHCSRLFVKKGQSVKKGQAIAAVGDTGNATGPHLHFEVWLDGQAVNPERVLPLFDVTTRITRRLDHRKP